MSTDPEASLIPVHVWLAGRSYRILVPPEEETALLQSVKKADEKITELRLHYAGKDDQDFVAMCLIMYASEHNKERPATADHVQILDLIKTIDQVLTNE